MSLWVLETLTDNLRGGLQLTEGNGGIEGLQLAEGEGGKEGIHHVLGELLLVVLAQLKVGT